MVRGGTRSCPNRSVRGRVLSAVYRIGPLRSSTGLPQGYALRLLVEPRRRRSCDGDCPPRAGARRSVRLRSAVCCLHLARDTVAAVVVASAQQGIDHRLNIRVRVSAQVDPQRPPPLMAERRASRGVGAGARRRVGVRLSARITTNTRSSRYRSTGHHGSPATGTIPRPFFPVLAATNCSTQRETPRALAARRTSACHARPAPARPVRPQAAERGWRRQGRSGPHAAAIARARARSTLVSIPIKAAGTRPKTLSAE